MKPGGPAGSINENVREKRIVTVATVLQLTKFFDTPARFWLEKRPILIWCSGQLEPGERFKHEATR